MYFPLQAARTACNAAASVGERQHDEVAHGTRGASLAERNAAGGGKPCERSRCQAFAATLALVRRQTVGLVNPQQEVFPAVGHGGHRVVPLCDGLGAMDDHAVFFGEGM